MLANSAADLTTGQRPPADLTLSLNELVDVNRREPVALGGASPGAPAGEGSHSFYRPALTTRPLFIREYGQHVAAWMSGSHGVLGFEDRRQPIAAANRTPWNEQQRVARQAPVGTWDDGTVLGQEVGNLA